MQIDAFKNHLEELTDFEKKVIIPMLIDALRYKTATSMVTSKQLSNYLKANHYSISPERVRKILAFASAANIKKGLEEHLGDNVIIACSQGYFVTDDVSVIDDLIDNLVKRRKNLDFRIDGITAQKINLQHKKSA